MTTNKPEVVAWIRKNGFRFIAEIEPQDDSEVPLYAAPQPAKPLTDEKIRIIWKETKARMGDGGDPVLWFARAIEHAHSILPQTKEGEQ